MILDGEIVAFDASGKPSFNALQNRFQLKTEREIAAADQKTPVVFCCFDILHFAGVEPARRRLSGQATISVSVPVALARSSSSCMQRMTAWP